MRAGVRMVSGAIIDIYGQLDNKHGRTSGSEVGAAEGERLHVRCEGGSKRPHQIGRASHPCGSIERDGWRNPERAH